MTSDVRSLCDAYDMAFMAQDWKTAEDSVRRALVLCPFDAPSLWRFAQLLGHHGDFAGAVQYGERAVSADPHDPNGWAVLSGAYSPLGMTRECAYAASRAESITGLFPMAQWNLAHAQLRLGDYKNGLRNYEWGPVIGFRRNRCTGPQWDGSAIPGKRLFVWCEQGIGDGIMFSRFVRRAKEQSQADVVLEVHQPLLTLLRGQSGADWVFGQSKFSTIPHEAADYDFHVSMASLPYVFGLDYADIDGAPYLQTVPGMDMEPVGNGKVGIVWKGSPTHANDKMRSIPLEFVKKLEGCADWVSLQHNPGELPFEVPDVGSCLSDFAFTAAALRQLELLVTCDTGTAHLAGALGVPTVMVVPLHGEWRWMMEGDRTNWYSSMTLVRPNDWDDAVAKVAKILADRGFKRTVKKAERATDPMRASWADYKNGKEAVAV